MITVLVTGGNGQLAQCFNSISSNYSKIRFIFKTSKELDITNKNQINNFFKSETKIDYSINCAAYTAVDKAETEQELANSINHIGVKNLAKACKVFETTLIHVSTDFVFDGTTNLPYTETDNTNPINVYGDTKLKGENAIIEELNNYFILRTSWLYSEFGNNFLKTMLRLATEKEELNIVSDQIGSPTYAKDFAFAIMKIIESKSTEFGIYHYSNSGSTSWYGFAKKIFELTNKDFFLNKINTENYPTLAKRPKQSVLDTTKIYDSLNINIFPWEYSLKNCLTTML